MAYATVYNAYYKKTNGTVREIRLRKDGYSGAVTEWKTALFGARFSFGGNDSIFSNTLCKSECNLGFIFEEQYEFTDFIEDPYTYICEVWESTTLVWTGFIEPWDARHEYKQPNYEVSMTASCGLNMMSKKDFYINDNNKSDLTEWETVLRCLGLIDNPKGIYVSVHTTMAAYPAAPNPLTSVVCDIYRYYIDNQWMAPDVILRNILNKFDAEIFQWNGKWVIRGIVDHAEGSVTYIEYDSAGTILGTGSFVVNKDVNSAYPDNSLTLDGSVIWLEGSVRKYIANVDLGPNRLRLENGGLQQWGPDGPIGWSMVAMPESTTEGYQQVDTGNETKPYALQINGFRPRPWTKKVKKKGWSFKKWYTVEIEPDSYVESPPFEIKETDQEITLSFEYYTEGGNGFAYSAMIHNANAPAGDLNEWFYYTKVVPAYDAQYSFTALFIAGHPVVNPETGVAQSKGKVEIKIRLQPQFIAWEYKTGNQFKADYIKVRFYKSHDDSKGGDSYTIYGLESTGTDITGETLDATDSDGKYKVVLSHNKVGNDIGEQIDLISGDYSMNYIGATYEVADANGQTGNWRRRGKSESLSIYKAMLIDRLNMTWKPGKVFEGDIKVVDPADDITYLTHIIMKDDADTRYKIVRLSKSEYRDVVTVTAIELRYQELNIDDYTQKNYTEGRGLIDEGDGVYPEREIPDVQIQDPDADLPAYEEEYYDNARVGILFNAIDPLEYVVGETGTDSVDLSDYFSELWDEGQDQEEEDRPDPDLLVVSVTDKPIWVTDIEIDGLVVTAIATPPNTGTYYIFIQIVDGNSDGLVIEQQIPVLVTENDEFVEEWPPKFLPLPTLYFIVGDLSTQHILMQDYLDPDGERVDGTGLFVRAVSVPGWVTNTNIVNFDFSVTGKPTEIGTWYISYELSDAIGRTSIFTVTLVAIEAPEIKYELLDTSGDTPLVVGELPGTYMKPDKWEVRSTVNGEHDKIASDISGGGDLGDEVHHTYVQPVIQTENGVYYAFQDTGGISSSTGFFELLFQIYLDDFITKKDVIRFALVDEELLAKIKIYLISEPSGDIIGEISIGGESVFLFPDTAWNVRFVVDDTNHDDAEWSLLLGEDEIHSDSATHAPSLTGTYEVYSTTQTGQVAGTYRTSLNLSLSGNPVFNVSTDFQIIEKEPEPEAGGINLITFTTGTVNYDILAEIPKSGAIYNLPDNWSILFTGFGVDVKSVRSQLFQKRSGALVEINSEPFTGYGDTTVYTLPKSELELLLWRYKNSTDIGNIHEAPSTFKVIFTGYDDKGDKVGIKESSWSFRSPNLDPEDFSGITFLYQNGSDLTVIDPDIPKTGMTYELPVSPAKWNTSAKKLPSGLPFDRVEMRLSKKVSGSYVVLHDQGPGYMQSVGIVVPIQELPDYSSALMIDSSRTALNPSNVPVNIDENGEYMVTYLFYEGIFLQGTLIAEFIIGDIPVDPPIEEGCGCECKEFLFTNQTVGVCVHDMDKYPDVTVWIDGKIVWADVTYTDNNTVTVEHLSAKTFRVEIC